MNELRKANRRKVLKTIGVGALGGTILTGTASASPNERTDIELRGHNFTPNSAKVRLGREGGSTTVRWTNDEVNYFGEGFPIPHDVHLHNDGSSLVESGIFAQKESFVHPELGGPIPLGPTYYEVEFSEEEGDLVITEVDGKVDNTGIPFPPNPNMTYDQTTINGWGGEVTLDVHCSVHSKYLDENEGEIVTKEIQEEEPPHQLHVGFFKMDGGLTITR